MQAPDPRHVADPMAFYAASWGNYPQQIGGGHVSAPLGGFSQPGVSPPVPWQTSGQFAPMNQGSGQQSQPSNQAGMPTVGNHVRSTCNNGHSNPSFAQNVLPKATEDRSIPKQSLNPSNPHNPNSSNATATKSFAKIVAEGTSFLRGSVMDLSPSPYPNLCYGQI